MIYADQIDKLIRREFHRRSGLGEAYTYDAQTNLQIKILTHHAEAFARACERNGIDEVRTMEIIEDMIAVGLPNRLQFDRLQEVEEHLKQHLMSAPPQIFVQNPRGRQG